MVALQYDYNHLKGMMEMEKKIVFFDIDGTIYNKEKKVPPSTVQAIQKLKENNVFVAIATGRAPFMYDDLRKQLNIDYCISFNGSYIVHNEEVIYKRPLSTEDISNLEKFASSHNHPMIFLDENDHYTNCKNHRHIQISIKEDLKLHYPHYDPYYFQENDIYQALIFCLPNEESIYQEQFPQFGYVRWHRYSIDVLPPGGSKASGIEVVLQKLNIDRKNSFAFGDGLNDLEMLQYVGVGVAMGNGHEKVKACADLVTKSVDDEGIEYALKELELI